MTTSKPTTPQGISAPACRTCNDTGQVWTAEQDDSGMWDMACPDCDTPYPLPVLEADR